MNAEILVHQIKEDRGILHTVEITPRGKYVGKMSVKAIIQIGDKFYEAEKDVKISFKRKKKLPLEPDRNRV